MYNRSDCFSNGTTAIHFARDDGSVMEYGSEYPFLPKRFLPAEDVSDRQQLCDIRMVGSHLFLIYAQKHLGPETTVVVTNTAPKRSSVLVTTPHTPATFTLSIDEQFMAHLTFFNTDTSEQHALASHCIDLTPTDNPVTYSFSNAMDSYSANFHVALPDEEEGLCDILATSQFVAILTPSQAIIYDLVNRDATPVQLLIPETDISHLGKDYRTFGGIQHPLLQMYRFFYIKSTLLILTPNCLYRVEHLPDKTTILTAVAKISNPLITYTTTTRALALCLANYTVIVVYAPSDADYLNISVYNLANDMNNRLFSVSLDYLAAATNTKAAVILEKLPGMWPAVPNPLSVQMDKLMDSVVTKRCVRQGSTNILSTFPSRRSHSNIRILLGSVHDTDDLLVALVHMHPASTIINSLPDFAIVASFVHKMNMAANHTWIEKLNSFSAIERTAFTVVKGSDTYSQSSLAPVASVADLVTGSGVVAAMSRALFINVSYLKTKPIVYYLHLLLNINVAICIALSKFLVTNSQFNNIKQVKRAKMSMLYDIITLRDDILHHLTREWDVIKTSASVTQSTRTADELQTFYLLAAYHNQDIPGLYTFLYYDTKNWLDIPAPSAQTGTGLLRLFTAAFSAGLSLYDLTTSLSLPASSRKYINVFTAIETVSLLDYVLSFRKNIFYAEFRLIAWALSTQSRQALGGKCSNSMPSLSDDVVASKSLYNKIDIKTLRWMPLYSNAEIPHESVYEIGGTIHHTMFLTSCHVSMDVSVYTQFNEELAKQINQYAGKLMTNRANARSFYLPHVYYIGTNKTTEESNRKNGLTNIPSSKLQGGEFADKLNKQPAQAAKLYCKFDPRMSIREFIRRFVPDLDVIMSVLSSIFGVLLDVVRTQGTRVKYTLRMINLDNVFIEFTSLNGYYNMCFFEKDLESSPYRIVLPYYLLCLDASPLFPSRGSVPVLLSESSYICPDYYPTLLLTGLVAQIFFELLQIYTAGALSSYDLFDLAKLSNVVEHQDSNGSVTYAPAPSSSKQHHTGNKEGSLYNPAMCDSSTAFETLFHIRTYPHQRLLYLNNIFLNIHLLAKLDIEVVIKAVYQSCSRIANQQFTVLALLKVYDLFCHSAANIIENPMVFQVTLKVLQERFGTHMQYYDTIFEPNLSINQSEFAEYIDFCKEKIPPFLLHLYDKSPNRDYVIVVESLLYSNEDLMYRQQIVNNYKSDPTYQAKLTEDPNHPIVRLKEAILELRLHRKYRVPCKVTKNKILRGMLEACMNATPITQMVCVTYESDPGIDSGGIFRSMISQCFMELLNEEEIRGSPILSMVEHTLIPTFLGYTPLASSEVHPRLSPKRSALYYLGRLFAFAIVYNVRFPKVFDSRLISCLIGGRLYLDDELREKYKAERESDIMFEINGTPINLVYPINSQFYHKYYSSANKMFLFALERLYREGNARGLITLPPEKLKDFSYMVSVLKGIPDYDVPEILDDLAIPDFIIETRRLTNTKNCVLKWIISLFNGIKTGEGFKKHLSEFRNGFRQPFGNTMSQKTDDRIKDACLRIDKALSEISLHDFEALFMADPAIDRKMVAEIIYPYSKSDPLEDLTASKQNIKDRKKLLAHLVSCLKEVILSPKLMDTAALGDFMYAATGSRYTIGITLYVKAHNDGPLVVFHTCNNVIEFPSSIKTADEMYKALHFSMYEAVHGGFGLV